MSIFGSKEARMPTSTPAFDELASPSFPRVVRNMPTNDSDGAFSALDREMKELKARCVHLEEENHNLHQQNALLVGECQAKGRENERLQNAVDDRDDKILREMTIAEGLRVEAIAMKRLADHFSDTVAAFVKAAMASANNAKSEQQQDLPLEDAEPVPAFLTKGPAES